MSGTRIILIIAGVALFCYGIYQMLQGLGVIGSHRSSSSSSAYGSSGTGISEQWLTGTWTPQSGVRCATWVRFNADHTLTDEVGARGTWQLRSYGVATGDLTMTINGMAPRTGNATRSGEDTLGLGSGRYYSRASC